MRLNSIGDAKCNVNQGRFPGPSLYEHRSQYMSDQHSNEISTLATANTRNLECHQKFMIPKNNYRGSPRTNRANFMCCGLTLLWLHDESV